MKKCKETYITIMLIIFILILSGCGKHNSNSEADTDGGQSTGEKDSITASGGAAHSIDEENPVSKGETGNQPAKRPNVTGLPDVIDTLEKDDGSKLVLVNKLHAVSENYEPIDMVPVDGSLSTNQGLYFKREAYEAYLKMLKDAEKDGIKFIICSTYRSYSTQKSIYNGYVSRNGADYANTVSAYPGRSEHHTGWAVDVTSSSMDYGLKQNFIEYPEGIWINNHCSEYGFIIRYPKNKTDITGYSYEPWHLRYVGVDVAKEITEKGITLEEYLGE